MDVGQVPNFFTSRRLLPALLDWKNCCEPPVSDRGAERLRLRAAAARRKRRQHTPFRELDPVARRSTNLASSGRVCIQDGRDKAMMPGEDHSRSSHPMYAAGRVPWL